MFKPRVAFNKQDLFGYLIFWLVAVLPLSIVVGSLVALFLWLLDWVTKMREQHSWLLFLLPVAGVLINYVYQRYGKNVVAGNNLIIDEIHAPGGGIPARMTPLVMFATLITHLFGGSAGREGTAVQMGGSIAALLTRYISLHPGNRHILLMCGVSAGFSAVFGTPFAATLFALEVVANGRIHFKALVPCCMAGLIADMVCRMYGIQHTVYTITWMAGKQDGIAALSTSLQLIVKVIIAAMVFGLVARFFATTMHKLKELTSKYVRPILLPVAGGVLVLMITWLLGTTDYLGLGVVNPGGGVSIVTAFTPGGATTWSWFWKLLLTVITLGAGFKGGEVTPLFFIGATLGNTIAVLSGAPIDLLAALGFIAVFAGATNTPLASTIMGVELFGGEYVLLYLVTCFIAFYVSGQKGIYTSQRRHFLPKL